MERWSLYQNGAQEDNDRHTFTTYNICTDTVNINYTDIIPSGHKNQELVYQAVKQF